MYQIDYRRTNNSSGISMIRISSKIEALRTKRLKSLDAKCFRNSYVVFSSLNKCETAVADFMHYLSLNVQYSRALTRQHAVGEFDC